jgi:hypothetical protein
MLSKTEKHRPRSIRQQYKQASRINWDVPGFRIPSDDGKHGPREYKDVADQLLQRMPERPKVKRSRRSANSDLTTIPRAKRPRLRATRSYEVERVLGKQVSPAGTISYLVRWKDYGPEFDEWKPASAMAKAQDVVEEYERRMALATSPHYSATLVNATLVPAKRGRGRPRKATKE